MRAALTRLVESERFQNAVMLAVLANAAVLGVDTYAAFPESVHYWCRRIDDMFVLVFVIEIGLKLAAWRGAFFKNAWNIFDFSVVGLSLLASGPFSVLRILRVLRALRLVSVIPQMRRVVEALIRAVPGISAIMGVLAVFFYIGAVLTTKMFGADHHALFGSLGRSTVTLFQVMLFDGWGSEVVREVGRTHPGSQVFFMAFTIVTGFAVLNLFIAVMVDALRAEHDRLEGDDLETLEEGQRETARDIDQIESAVARLESKIDAVMTRLDAIAAPPRESGDREDT
ncbi:MAG: ion transporter [Maricaulaceae bacterium]|jgi:voltage-gated sodium channel